MNSQTMKLPVIDFSALKPGTDHLLWESLKQKVRTALEEHGCFEAFIEEIPPNVRKSLFDGSQQLFNLPLEQKLRNRSDKPYRGYIGQHAAVPLYESLGIDDALSPGNLESFTNLMFCDSNPTFCNSVKVFLEKMSKLDQLVRRMVVESLKLEKYFDEHMEFTTNGFRVQKYNAPQSHDPKLGLSSHTDKIFMNILYQNEVKGLQILTKDGQHWITVEPSPNSFIVLIGDYFLAWTNGRLHSPHHRVMMTGDNPRYSIGLSCAPKEGYLIKAPEEMVDEEHPLLFNPFDHDEFYEFFYSEEGRKSSNPLKDYCGAKP